MYDHAQRLEMDFIHQLKWIGQDICHLKRQSKLLLNLLERVTQVRILVLFSLSVKCNVVQLQKEYWSIFYPPTSLGFLGTEFLRKLLLPLGANAKG